MTILGIAALIVVVILGVMVLRVKSDPMEDESVRKYLTDPKRTDGDSNPPTGASREAGSTAPGEEKLGN